MAGAVAYAFKTCTTTSGTGTVTFTTADGLPDGFLATGGIVSIVTVETIQTTEVAGMSFSRGVFANDGVGGWDMACMGMSSQNGQGTSNSYNIARNDKVLHVLSYISGTVKLTGTVTDVSAATASVGVTITLADGDNTTRYIFLRAFGGTATCQVDTFTHGSGDSQTVTINSGEVFTNSVFPDLVFAGGNDTATFSSTETAHGQMSWGFGKITGATPAVNNQLCGYWRMTDGVTTTSNQSHWTDNGVMSGSSTGTETWKVLGVTGTEGSSPAITLTQGGAADDYAGMVLCVDMDGTEVDVGQLTLPVDTTGYPFNEEYTNLTIEPVYVELFASKHPASQFDTSTSNPSGASVQNEAYLSETSGDTHTILLRDQDGVTTTSTGAAIVADEPLRIVEADGGTTTGEATQAGVPSTLADMFTDSSLTLSMTNYKNTGVPSAFATAFYWAVGAKVEGTATGTLPSLSCAATGTAAVNGTATGTLPTLTCSAAGTATVEGTATGTLPSLACAATGTAPINGTSSVTLPSLACASSGSAAINGTATGSLAMISVAATGLIDPATGTVAATLPSISCASSGTAAVSGTATGTLPSLSAAAVGYHNPGEAAATLPSLSCAASGSATINGTGAPTIPALACAASGTAAVNGTATGTLPSLSCAASGSSTGLVTGTGATSLPSITCAASGTAAINGTATGTLPSLTCAATGLADGLVAGTGTATLPAITCAATGSAVIAGDATGEKAAELPALQCSAVGYELTLEKLRLQVENKFAIILATHL